MAKGVAFDFYQPQAPTPAGQGGKPTFTGDRRTAPGPEIAPCCECGDTIGPHWSEYGEVFCPRHVPDHLKFPGHAP